MASESLIRLLAKEQLAKNPASFRSFTPSDGRDGDLSRSSAELTRSSSCRSLRSCAPDRMFSDAHSLEQRPNSIL